MNRSVRCSPSSTSGSSGCRLVGRDRPVEPRWRRGRHGGARVDRSPSGRSHLSARLPGSRRRGCRSRAARRAGRRHCWGCVRSRGAIRQRSPRTSATPSRPSPSQSPATAVEARFLAPGWYANETWRTFERLAGFSLTHQRPALNMATPSGPTPFQSPATGWPSRGPNVKVRHTSGAVTRRTASRQVAPRHDADVGVAIGVPVARRRADRPCGRSGRSWRPWGGRSPRRKAARRRRGTPPASGCRGPTSPPTAGARFRPTPAAWSRFRRHRHGCVRGTRPGRHTRALRGARDPLARGSPAATAPGVEAGTYPWPQGPPERSHRAASPAPRRSRRT